MNVQAGAAALQSFDDAPGGLIDTASIPGGGYLQLFRVGEGYEIMFDGEQLMSSWSSRSERALATLACGAVRASAPAVLIGGLGMGFTLTAALAALPADAHVTVAELVPAVAGWAAGPLAHIHEGSLADPRVALAIADVHDLIDRSTARFDAILLDVDNGPDGLVQAANERLYCAWGLRAAAAALRPGGVLAVWSAYPDGDFRDRLAASGFAVTEHAIEPQADEPDRHIVWLARKGD